MRKCVLRQNSLAKVNFEIAEHVRTTNAIPEQNLIQLILCFSSLHHKTHRVCVRAAALSERTAESGQPVINVNDQLTVHPHAVLVYLDVVFNHPAEDIKQQLELVLIETVEPVLVVLEHLLQLFDDLVHLFLELFDELVELLEDLVAVVWTFLRHEVFDLLSGFLATTEKPHAALRAALQELGRA